MLLRAARAIGVDPKVDALQREIEHSAIRLLPLGGDLRLIIATLKASDDLERIGVGKTSCGTCTNLPSHSNWPASPYTEEVSGTGQQVQLTKAGGSTFIRQGRTHEVAAKA